LRLLVTRVSLPVQARVANVNKMNDEARRALRATGPILESYQLIGQPGREMECPAPTERSGVVDHPVKQ
jgi:hypothetical protein